MAEDMANYKDFEKIAGRDSIWEVAKYRATLIMVDLLSMAAFFAFSATLVLICYAYMLVFLVKAHVATSVLITYLGMGLAFLGTWLTATIYLCARKYTPPLVEAMAERIAGKGRDIVVAPEPTNTSTASLPKIPPPPVDLV
jgi:hypothetical protein